MNLPDPKSCIHKLSIIQTVHFKKEEFNALGHALIHSPVKSYEKTDSTLMPV